MKKYLFILCFSAGQTFAQSFSLTGTITNIEGLQPIADVYVVVKETNQHSHTDIQGKYLLSNLAEGFI